MRERLKRCESLLWLFMKIFLYILLMAIFVLLLSIENRALIRPSRTMGTTLITFVVVGLLFMMIYGKFDVGRRKSKPIIYSMSLAHDYEYDHSEHLCTEVRKYRGADRYDDCTDHSDHHICLYRECSLFPHSSSGTVLCGDLVTERSG